MDSESVRSTVDGWMPEEPWYACMQITIQIRSRHCKQASEPDSLEALEVPVDSAQHRTLSHHPSHRTKCTQHAARQTLTMHGKTDTSIHRGKVDRRRVAARVILRDTNHVCW